MLHTSIAMCTYNGERFLLEQLQSFVNQSTLPDELVVCDDCSQDATLEILKKFEAEAPFPVRIYSNSENLGFIKNFEKAISLCQNEIIFLCDQDDIWMPEKIAECVSEFEKDADLGLICHGFLDVDEKNEIAETANSVYGIVAQNMLEHAPCFNTEMERVYPQLLAKSWHGCAMVFRNRLEDIYLPFPDEFQHDFWLFNFYAVSSNIKYLEKSLIRYRHHERNVMGKIEYIVLEPPCPKKKKPIPLKIVRELIRPFRQLWKLVFAKPIVLPKEINFQLLNLRNQMLLRAEKHGMDWVRSPELFQLILENE